MLLDLGRSDSCAAARADICSRGSAGECHLALSSRCPTTECLLAHCSAVYPDSTLATCAATVNRNPIVSVDHETEGRRAFRLREAGSGFDAEAVTMSTPWPPRHRERRLSAGGSGAGDGLHRRPEPAPRQTRPDYRSRHGSAPGCGRRCGRYTGPARRASSTSRASGRAWSTGARASCGTSSCSSPCSAPAASPMPRRPRPSCRTGSTRTSAWSSTSVAPLRCGSPTS